MKIELQRWQTPNYVTGIMPAGKRQDGFNPDSVPKWHISEVDAETLAEQCDKFRAEVFEKAGKVDPAKYTPHHPVNLTEGQYGVFSFGSVKSS